MLDLIVDQVEPSDPEEEVARRERLKEAFAGVIGKLARQADEWVGRRNIVELRWLEDLRQYHGQIDSETRAKMNRLKAEGRARSEALVNVTRSKTNAMAARLVDMLFPSDERCWAIKPTPVPGLNEETERAAQQAREAAKQAREAADQDGQPPAPAKVAADIAKEHYAKLRATMDAARDRAEAMQREIDDQLVEGHFNAEARDVIEDACKVGGGVIEAPIANERMRQGWRLDKETGTFKLQYANRPRACARRVDFWSFFPDPDSITLAEGQGAYVRSLETPRGMRKLARAPGVDQDAVRRLLKSGPTEPPPWYLADLRAILGETTTAADKRFCVWRYVGAIEPEDLNAIAQHQGDTLLASIAGEADPLDEINVEILFCGAELLRVEPHPLDSGESPFSIFRLERDEASVWGYGIPYIIRNEQRIMNAGWRAMMDNAGVAAGPQVVRDSSVTTRDGTNMMRPWQEWLFDGKNMPPNMAGRVPFELIQPDMNQEQLANIIAMARAQIDDVTSMPQIQQGEQGEQTTKTVGGMAMLMSSGNVTYRRIVRNWDDDVSSPVIRRMYDWNMQHSDKEAIKGDYAIVARGSSVLLVREMQAQNLQWLMANFQEDPLIDIEEVKKAFFRALLMSADQFIRSYEEQEEWLAQQAERAGPTEADLKAKEIEVLSARIDADVAIAEMRVATDQMIARTRHETAMMTLAETMNIEVEKLDAMMRKSREAAQQEDRVIAAEIAMSERERALAAEQGRHPMGSGGFIA